MKSFYWKIRSVTDELIEFCFFAAMVMWIILLVNFLHAHRHIGDAIRCLLEVIKW
jgi:hypothetical protein